MKPFVLPGFAAVRGGSLEETIDLVRNDFALPESMA